MHEFIQGTAECQVPNWPTTTVGIMELLRQRLKEAEMENEPLVVKELANQIPFDELQPYIGWLRENFTVVLILRSPQKTLLSLARVVEDEKEFLHHICWTQVPRMVEMFPPDIILQVEKDLVGDKNPRLTLRSVWGVDGTTETDLLDLPELTQEQKTRAGFHMWPSWFTRAVETQKFVEKKKTSAGQEQQKDSTPKREEAPLSEEREQWYKTAIPDATKVYQMVLNDYASKFEFEGESKIDNADAVLAH